MKLLKNLKKTAIAVIFLMTAIFGNAQQLHDNSRQPPDNTPKPLNNAQRFTLSGRITDLKNVHIYIQYTNAGGKLIKDSCITANGDYRFSGNISEPTRIYVAAFPGTFKMVDDSEPNVTSIYAEPGNIKANGSYEHLKEMKVTGSKTNDEALQLAKQSDELNKRYAKRDARYHELLNQYNEELKKTHGNQRLIDSLNEQMEKAKEALDPAIDEYISVTLPFVKKHPGSYISIWQLSLFAVRLKLDELKSLYGQLSSAVRNSQEGQKVAEFIRKTEENTTGQVAKDFQGTAPDGKLISLHDFKGKYVLIDFWGSWCVPCRQGFPRLKELFNKYHAAGLEIIGIAVDDSQDSWTKAIDTDGSGIWNNIKEKESQPANGRDPNAIHQLYGIQVFPTKILVGRDGVIVGRYDGTDSPTELDNKLADLFK